MLTSPDTASQTLNHPAPESESRPMALSEPFSKSFAARNAPSSWTFGLIAMLCRSLDLFFLFHFEHDTKDGMNQDGRHLQAWWVSGAALV